MSCVGEYESGSRPYRVYVRRSPARPHATNLLWPARRIFFVGDSISRQHMGAFACHLLHSMGWGRSSVRFEPPAMPSWFREVTLVRSSVNHLSVYCRPTCVRIHVPGAPALQHGGGKANLQSGLQLCFVAAGMHYASCAFSLARQVRQLVTRNVSAAGDVFIVNDGLHAIADLPAISDGDNPSRAAPRLQAFLRDVSEGGLAALLRRHHVLWRETSPQHFGGSASGAFNRTDRLRRENYSHIDATWTCEPLLSPRRTDPQELLRALEAAGVGVLRVWNLTASQWDMHLDVHRRVPGLLLGSPRAGEPLDCTHFCEPSGVLEAWSDATLGALARLAG